MWHYYGATILRQNMDIKKIQNTTKQWVETVVIGLNLCPFAKQEFINDRIHFYVTDANSIEQLLLDLKIELDALNQENHFETTLLIHPNILQNFDEYNQFLGAAEQLLTDLALEGVFQIASFHPDYQFADTQPEDVENYTNRSPFPMLHIIREASLEVAVERYPDPEQISQRNIALLKSMGRTHMQMLLKACYK